jgi:hypothetical protein
MNNIHLAHEFHSTLYNGIRAKESPDQKSGPSCIKRRIPFRKKILPVTHLESDFAAH